MLRIINDGVEESVDVGARAERVVERRDAATRRSAARTRRAGGGTLRGTPLRSAYETFLLERVGLRVQPRTLEFYELNLGKHFLGWLEAEHPEITAVEDVDVQVMREFRAHEASRGYRRPRNREQAGKRLQNETLNATQRAIKTFFLWARDDGYDIDERIVKLKLTAPSLGRDGPAQRAQLSLLRTPTSTGRSTS